MKLMKIKPLYNHDCDACVFLETWQEMDWYFCPSKLFGGDIVGRVGSDGQEYCSMAIQFLTETRTVEFYKNNPGSPTHKSGYMYEAYVRNESTINQITNKIH